MDLYCTRPSCPRPTNVFPDLDNPSTLKTVEQKYCTACGMPLILDGRYLAVRLLNQGGFGAAFLARDRRMPNLRPCVLKQFQPPPDLNPQGLAAAQNLFEQEGEVLAELGNRHPQIPNLYAYFSLQVANAFTGQPQEMFYLAQEFVEGQNLEQELAQQGPFSEAQAQEVLVAMLKVLQFVHEHHVIHRDIKPSNIMRHQDGRLYLLDFGAVKQITQSSGASGSTGIYSQGYAPPEQTTGGQVYPATDLYALAVTCLTLLTGKQPLELLDSYHQRWQWRSYTQVSDRLGAVLDRLLQPVPTDRFTSAEEVLMALQQPGPSPALTPASTGSLTKGLSRKQGSNLPTLTPVPSGQISPSGVPTGLQPYKSPSGLPMGAQSLSPFPVWEFLIGAAFTGVQGGMLALVAVSLLPPAVGAGLALVLITGLAIAQVKRWIGGWDLLILPVLSLGVLWFLRSTLVITLPAALVLIVLTSFGTVALASLFRLVYLILSRILQQ